MRREHTCQPTNPFKQQCRCAECLLHWCAGSMCHACCGVQPPLCVCVCLCMARALSGNSGNFVRLTVAQLFMVPSGRCPLYYRHVALASAVVPPDGQVPPVVAGCPPAPPGLLCLQLTPFNEALAVWPNISMCCWPQQFLVPPRVKRCSQM